MSNKKSPMSEEDMILHKKSMIALAKESNHESLVDGFQKSTSEFYSRRNNDYWKVYHRIKMEEFSAEILRRLNDVDHTDFKLVN